MVKLPTKNRPPIGRSVWLIMGFSRKVYLDYLPGQGINPHNRMVPSRLADPSSLPSEENATPLTQEVCPLRLASDWPVATSHNWIGPSNEPEASVLPSGEKARLAPESMLPPGKARDLPVATSHSITVLSNDPVARVLPSGEKTTLYTIPV